ncbi:hypothetical protein K2X14_10200 [Acetobacter sp. TBRC 12305]|uniref:Burkholderia phage Bcep781 gp06 n=1 Tax=Acetobacter garciniae TaxID=2817435 RepID=A0A939KQZ3_9PROT|nr:hypothetical protein [Acetobacter garciniae]MBO1326052.1 hypothetical protein [Acetobacter garciniae]MBX0345204.1 hypothetical protein [Acetobacter garciniae]
MFSIALRATGVVNAPITATVRSSTGNVVQADGAVTPQYSAASLQIEVQALSTQDLRQIDTISQQADMRAVYMNAPLRALNRPLQLGGDMLSFYGSDWLVTQVLEDWGNGEWVKVVVTRQDPPPATPAPSVTGAA